MAQYGNPPLGPDERGSHPARVRPGLVHRALRARTSDWMMLIAWSLPFHAILPSARPTSSADPPWVLGNAAPPYVLHPPPPGERSGAYGLVTDAQNLLAIFGVLRVAAYAIEAQHAIRRGYFTRLFRIGAVETPRKRETR